MRITYNVDALCVSLPWGSDPQRSASSWATEAAAELRMMGFEVKGVAEDWMQAEPWLVHGVTVTERQEIDGVLEVMTSLDRWVEAREPDELDYEYMGG